MQFTKSGLRGCLVLPRQMEAEERLGAAGWADQHERGLCRRDSVSPPGRFLRLNRVTVDALAWCPACSQCPGGVDVLASPLLSLPLSVSLFLSLIFTKMALVPVHSMAQKSRVKL